MMIVIGGKESSNTRKLFEISKRNCKHTYHIETFEDLPQEKTYNKIGITAGASTPGSIIEEVVKAMSENLKNEEYQNKIAFSVFAAVNEYLSKK